MDNGSVLQQWKYSKILGKNCLEHLVLCFNQLQVSDLKKLEM